MFESFILRNRVLSGRCMKHLPNAHDVLDDYGEIVGRYMRDIPSARVVDVGGGRDCAFARYRRERNRICAVDISGEELSHNRVVDEKYVADATISLPLPSGSADMVTSRAVIEHMQGVRSYVREAYRVLKPQGTLITGFPNKWAPGALLNRWIPEGLKRSLLFWLIPDSRGKCGFPAYYQFCSEAQFTRLLKETGFEVTEIRRGYFQADYLAFFFPFFLVAAAWDWFCWRLDLSPLCSAVLLCATKSGAPATSCQEKAESRELLPSRISPAEGATAVTLSLPD